MTKEEKELIFNRLFELEGQHPAFAESIKDNAYCEAIADVKHIIDGIKETSLPSNLDEAAEEFAKRQGIELAPFARKFFKAGAEWMAGQGVTKEMEVTDTNGIIVSDTPLDLSGFRLYEKVIVQVRKK